MGYVPTELSKPGTMLQIDVRGRPIEVAVQRAPFYTGGSIKR
jgi:glycine cleavage system aminomethyltransferase T